MVPARREKARVDPIIEFSQSQSSNDLDYDLKKIMVQQYCAMMCKKRVKEDKVILRDAVEDSRGQFSETGTDLVEALKVVEEAWESLISEHAKLNDKIARDVAALENHELELVRQASELKKHAANNKKGAEQQAQSLEKMRGVYGVTERLWNQMNGGDV